MRSWMSGLCIVCIVFSCPCNMIYIIGVFHKLRDKERSKESAYFFASAYLWVIEILFAGTMVQVLQSAPLTRNAETAGGVSSVVSALSSCEKIVRFILLFRSFLRLLRRFLHRQIGCSRRGRGCCTTESICGCQSRERGRGPDFVNAPPKLRVAVS